MSDKGKERIKSLYKLYGTAKFKIDPKKFDDVTGNQNSQIKSYMDIIFHNNLKTNNFGYYIISFSIIIIFIFIYLREFINEFIQHSKENWSEYKCDPRFLAYGGYIVKNENRTEFESTEDNFYECIKPLTEKSITANFDPFNDLISGIKSGSNSLAANVGRFSDSIKNLQTAINSIKEQALSIVQDLFKEEDNKNQAVTSSSSNSLDLTKKINALAKLLNQMIIGGMYTSQSTLTYVYAFFEGMLVVLSIIIVPLIIVAGIMLYFAGAISATGAALTAFIPTIPAGMALISQGTKLFVIFALLAIIILALICLFIAVVAVMILYKGFLKVVFGINVQDRRTKTPKSPYS
tara:strand:+ start:273 stop:1319 length:1047 start_codon:yes stop_codon:yes gene_type:complete